MGIKRRRHRREPMQEPAPASKSRLTKMLELPAAALPGLPQIEISGNQEAVVEGCQGILEYDENVIRLSAGKMSIRFTGRNLQVRVLTQSSAVVAGFLTGVEFHL